MQLARAELRGCLDGRIVEGHELCCPDRGHSLRTTTAVAEFHLMNVAREHPFVKSSMRHDAERFDLAVFHLSTSRE